MRYVEVAVDAPIGYNRTLSYSIPPRLELEPGQMVWVPLGTRPVQGIVFGLTDRPQVEVVKDVIAAVEPSPLVTPIDLELARWISRYYMSPLFDSIALMLPPGFETRVRSYIRVAPQRSPSPGALPYLPPSKGNSISSTEEQALGYLASRGEVSEVQMVKALGRDGGGTLRRLLSRGLLQRRWELPGPNLSHKYECYIRAAASHGQTEEAERLEDKAPKQMALYKGLALSNELILLSLAHKEYGTSAVNGLLAKGLLAQEWIRVEREPSLQREMEASSGVPIVITQEQERALAEITSTLEGKPGAKGPFLLHGVTGSGKTEVYLRALASCVGMGKKGIFLVPEIALAPQTVHRLNARFPGRVAVLHSRLSTGEQFDQWWRIRDGEYDAVVGPRSALFAPVPDLGLIVIDEEHEWTYKQQDATPHYHAREAALKLAKLTGAVVVMGSATPDVATYFRAKDGEYTLLELPKRVPASSGARRGAAGLARVEICDMKCELEEGNRSIFSRSLVAALEQCARKGEQSILFLNRRGSSTIVQCRDCGYALRCRSCSVTLTYHAADMSLLCHHCNRRTHLPKGCPECRSPRIRYLGLGTQRVVEELRRHLPHVVALRWDGDTSRAPHAHENIMESFLRGEAQVLIGTQMIAKGLHLPNVSLVGVVLADVGLNLPDFRAGERAFQLLCQVAGRAGRGTSPGRVIIQTYNPTNYAVEAAAKQDYGLLYSKEIGFRQQHNNPPFSRLVHMIYVDTNPEACQREAVRMGRVLRHRAYSLGLTDVEVVGPAPAFPERVRGRYRWHMIIRGRNLQTFLDHVNITQGWTVDLDPVSVL